MTSIVLRAAALPIVLAAVSAVSAPAAAQGRSAEDTRTIDRYRLTMPCSGRCSQRSMRQEQRAAGKVSALAPGVVRDNALLLEQNDPEIKKLTKAGAQS